MEEIIIYKDSSFAIKLERLLLLPPLSIVKLKLCSKKIADYEPMERVCRVLVDFRAALIEIAVWQEFLDVRILLC